MNIEEMKKIVEGAPERATHYAQGMHYLACNNSGKWMRYDPNGIGGLCWFDANEFKFSYTKNFHNLADLRVIIELSERVRELEDNREKAYEKWQSKYQQLKDGLTLTPCYECGVPVHELSPRSRCCMCEYGRANFNEKENNQLREQ